MATQNVHYFFDQVKTSEKRLPLKNIFRTVHLNWSCRHVVRPLFDQGKKVLSMKSESSGSGFSTAPNLTSKVELLILISACSG